MDCKKYLQETGYFEWKGTALKNELLILSKWAEIRENTDFY